MSKLKVPKTEPTTPVESQKSAAQQPLLEERIRIRAYELFLARNREPGHENDDWFQAEAEVAQKPAETTK